MNAKQRRKSKRVRIRAPFSLEFTSAKQGNVTQFMDSWIKIARPELIDDGSPYPVNIGDPLLSPELVVVDMNISFDFEVYEQSASKEKLA